MNELIAASTARSLLENNMKEASTKILNEFLIPYINQSIKDGVKSCRNSIIFDRSEFDTPRGEYPDNVVDEALIKLLILLKQSEYKVTSLYNEDNVPDTFTISF